jgi:hypothetical protein
LKIGVLKKSEGHAELVSASLSSDDEILIRQLTDRMTLSKVVFV